MSWTSSLCRLRVVVWSTRQLSTTGLTRALVVHPSAVSRGHTREKRLLDPWLLNEAVGLATTLGWEVVHEEIVRQRGVSPRSFLRKGKIEELKCLASHTGADVVLINTPTLTARQQSDLAATIGVKAVFDRFRVIVDIFGARALTSEARLQVELARLKYELSHVAQSGEKYDQQGGGIGMMGGGGERATEVQRRVIREKIRNLQSRLEVVRKRRRLQREDRHQPVVSLVGYTNAGKSSLLNKMTKTSAVSARDRPFETLDTTVRALYLPSIDAQCLLTDTVGFVTSLPHDLVAAFRATLEEVAAADVLIHVRDVSTIGTPIFEAQRGSVLEVLREIKCSESLLGTFMVEVWNKEDLLDQDDPETTRHVQVALREAQGEGVTVIMTSTKTGKGLPELLQAVTASIKATGRVRHWPGEQDDEDDGSEESDEETRPIQS